MTGIGGRLNVCQGGRWMFRRFMDVMEGLAIHVCILFLDLFVKELVFHEERFNVMKAVLVRFL
jgi:hypothetical protein